MDCLACRKLVISFLFLKRKNLKRQTVKGSGLKEWWGEGEKERKKMELRGFSNETCVSLLFRVGGRLAFFSHGTIDPRLG